MDYQDILWNRPIRRTGRILLAGGHRDGFAELQKAYVGFDVAGAAECHLALPDKLSRLVGNLEGISLLASNPSGSIARDATAELTHLANESDAICIGPDLSHNSETTLTMQRVITETRAAVIIPPATTEQLLDEALAWKDKENLLLFINQKQLYKLATKLAANVTIPLSASIDNLTEIATAVSKLYKPSLVIQFKDYVIVAAGGEASSTKIELQSADNGALVGLLGLFWLQNATKPLQALAAASHIAQLASGHGFQDNIKQELAKL